eukprot:scaffold119101_cov20-Tisochrysis_lutea.AAC.1
MPPVAEVENKGGLGQTVAQVKQYNQTNLSPMTPDHTTICFIYYPVCCIVAHKCGSSTKTSGCNHHQDVALCFDSHRLAQLTAKYAGNKSSMVGMQLLSHSVTSLLCTGSQTKGSAQNCTSTSFKTLLLTCQLVMHRFMDKDTVCTYAGLACIPQR